MATVTVTVTYDANSNTLTLDPSKVNVDLNPGEPLEWDFLNVPSNCVPGILFVQESGVSEPAFGPFQALLLQGNSVVGRGNLGTFGVFYSYNAQLLDVDGVKVTSASNGTVHNLISVPDMSPITVIPCQTSFNSSGQQVVSIGIIDALNLFVGDTAIWYVSGLPTDAFVNFVFTLPSGDSAIAPFSSLIFNRGVEGEGSLAVQVIGVDFQPGGTDSFTYKVQVRNFFGDVIPPTDDPQIDSLGPPPQG